MAQWPERSLVGAREPCLTLEAQQPVEQCPTPPRVKMGGNLVEEEERGLAPNRPLQPDMGEQDRDQQSLLLPRRGELGRNPFLRQAAGQIRTVRPDLCAADLRITLPVGRQCRGQL